MQFPIPVLMEDELVHTDERPFCQIDPTCPCHRDPYLLQLVGIAVHLGLLSPDQVQAVIAGTLPATFAANGIRIGLRVLGKKRVMWI